MSELSLRIVPRRSVSFDRTDETIRVAFDIRFAPQRQHPETNGRQNDSMDYWWGHPMTLVTLVCLFSLALLAADIALKIRMLIQG
jgi:hypothetical protein